MSNDNNVILRLTDRTALSIGLSFYAGDFEDIWYQVNGYQTMDDGEELASVVAVGQLGREPAYLSDELCLSTEERQRLTTAILQAVPRAWQKLTGVIAGGLVAGKVIQ
jgi:hypothetical protein